MTQQTPKQTSSIHHSHSPQPTKAKKQLRNYNIEHAKNEKKRPKKMQPWLKKVVLKKKVMCLKYTDC